MGIVISNEQLKNKEYYIIKIKKDNEAKPGQFYMLRSWDIQPVLSRPISVYDANDEEVSFLYRVVGEGTENLTKLESGDEITLDGPYGLGFPLKENAKALLIGGGIGIAPLYYLGKELKKVGTEVDIYFSLRGEEIIREELTEASDNLVLKTNERVVALPNYADYDVVYTCGPERLMEDVYENTKAAGIPLYASFEKKMGCGFGVCSGCTQHTADGNKLVCKDGPVFLGEEVFELD
ncbi:MAG: dihydroorotate dehydrogenase electron transfer subunit [Tissierellia bacterium]|nr:dihydroorotate dehydrogenase electron transfer subunit [Tissierellia bacterium]